MENLLNSLIQIKGVIATENQDDLITTINEVSKKNKIELEVLTPYVNLIQAINTNDKKTLRNGMKLWSKEELLLVNLYVTQYEGKQSKNNSLEQVSNLLDRTTNSTKFTYYNQIKNNKEKHQITDYLKEQNFNYTKKETETNKDEALDHIQTFIEKTEQIEEFDINGFFKGIANLSKLAIENNQKRKNERNALEELSSLKEELQKSQEINDQLLEEFIELKEIFNTFDNLDSIKKLAFLKKYNDDFKEIFKNIEEIINTSKKTEVVKSLI